MPHIKPNVTQSDLANPLYHHNQWGCSNFCSPIINLPPDYSISLIVSPTRKGSLIFAIWKLNLFIRNDLKAIANYNQNNHVQRCQYFPIGCVEKSISRVYNNIKLFEFIVSCSQSLSDVSFGNLLKTYLILILPFVKSSFLSYSNHLKPILASAN